MKDEVSISTLNSLFLEMIKFEAVDKHAPKFIFVHVNLLSFQKYVETL